MSTAAYIITKGYESCNRLTVGATPNADQFARGLDLLNDIIAFEATQGMKIWLDQDIPIPLVSGQATYNIGPGGDVNMAKPMNAMLAYYLTVTGAKTPLTIISQQEWVQLSQSPNPGALNSFYPNKLLNFLQINFYNTPDAQAATGVAHIVGRVPQDSLVVTSDTVGFSKEWVLFLRWAMADELANGQPQEVQARCEKRAATYRAALNDFDVEDGPVYLQADSRMSMGYGRFK